MTKAELVKALECFPDDAEIYVPSTKVSNAWVHASYVVENYGGDDGWRKDMLIVGSDMKYKAVTANKKGNSTNIALTTLMNV